MSHQSEIAALTRTLSAAMTALEHTLSGHQEVVLHNLTRPAASVVKILNGHVSGRTVGDSLLSGPEKDAGFAGLLRRDAPEGGSQTIANYTTQTAGGKLLNSASTLYFSQDGTPLMAFCINVDATPLDNIRKGLEALGIAAITQDEKTEPSLDHLIDQGIQEIIDRHVVGSKKIQKAQRQRIVAEMQARGIFKMKGGVQQAAQALGVTRYTVYNDLEALGEK